MRLLVFICFVSLLGPAACKTSSDHSESKAWLHDENKQATAAFARSTVHQFFVDVPLDDPTLQQFSDALVEQYTEQTESADYLLHGHYEYLRTGGSPNDPSPLQKYILEQFVTLTNYYAHRDEPTSQALALLKAKAP